MTDAPAPAAVPLSRAPVSETPGHPRLRRDSAGTLAETVDLKALARLVLARDNHRDTRRDNVPHVDSGAETPAHHDEGVPGDWAGGVAGLDPDCPPADVPPGRWRGFVDDARRFLASDFAAAAAALGWSALDLFGCDRDRPFARIDRAGLLWLLSGSRLVALTTDAARIETRTGARQTWRRKPAEPGRLLAWEQPP